MVAPHPQHGSDVYGDGTATALDRARRLEALQAEFEQDARFGVVFVVLTLGAALIATLGLLANSAAVDLLLSLRPVRCGAPQCGQVVAVSWTCLPQARQ